ncbi:molybdenum cofactor biosynthesis protein MoaE [Paenibacillus tarimensis]
MTTFTIQLFAGLSERFGQTSISLAFEEPELQIRELKERIIERFPEHSDLVRVSFVAKNQAYASDDEYITGTDEIALLPPVSGGEDTQIVHGKEVDGNSLFQVTSSPLSVEHITALVNSPANGAALTFIGTTREWTYGKRTVRLEYEAYIPMAEHTLRQIGDEINSKWPGARCAIHHRIGVVEIAEASVVIAVSAPHRAQCYEASRYAIERLKQVVPIWKKEIWQDGSEWKGHQLGPWNPLSPL